MSVAVVASATTVFPVVLNSATPGVLSFTPTAGCDFIVALVGYANSDPLVYPKVTVDGRIMQVLASPYEIEDDKGAVMAFALVVDPPIVGAVDVIVSCVPDFMGWTGISIFATTGSAKLLGKVTPDTYGTHDAGVQTGTTELPGITEGAAVVFYGGTFFGADEVTALDVSAGWTPAGGAHLEHVTAYGFYAPALAAGDYDITLSSGTFFFNLHCLGVEIPAAGAVAPDSDVIITATAQIKVGALGADTFTTSFDPNGAELLMIVSSRSNDGSTGTAAHSFAGIPLVFRDTWNVKHLDTETNMDVAFIAAPPDGPHDLVVTGHSGYFGYTVVSIVGLANLSGVVGARAILSSSGQGATLGLDPSAAGSRLIAFVTNLFPRASETPNYGWSTVSEQTDDFSMNTFLFTAVGGADVDLVLKAGAFASFGVVLLEFEVPREDTPAITAAGDVDQDAPIITGTATNLGKLTPAGQDYHVYWETWDDQPNKDRALLQPDDFMLARVPSYVTDVLLSFGIPQATWANPDDNLFDTTGLEFPGTARLLKATIDLLHERNPGTNVWIAVQQHSARPDSNQPYDPLGWWGMTLTHVHSWGALCAYLGVVGIIIDFEVLSTLDGPEFRCVRNLEDDTVACYTDADLVRTLKLMREGLPRPFKLIVDAIHVGAYGVGPYVNAAPNGPNSGYSYCLTQDAEALAAVDGIHCMTYDAGNQYNPLTAISAFKLMFPDTPLWLGVRVGPRQYQDVKQSGDEIMNFANAAIMFGINGLHMYSGMWDVAILGRNRPHIGEVEDGNFDDGDAPFYNYKRAQPDGNIAGHIIAEIFQLGTADVPAGHGPTCRFDELRMNNRTLLNGPVPML